MGESAVDTEAASSARTAAMADWRVVRGQTRQQDNNAGVPRVAGGWRVSVQVNDRQRTAPLGQTPPLETLSRHWRRCPRHASCAVGCSGVRGVASRQTGQNSRSLRAHQRRSSFLKSHHGRHHGAGASAVVARGDRGLGGWRRGHLASTGEDARRGAGVGVAGGFAPSGRGARWSHTSHRSWRHAQIASLLRRGTAASTQLLDLYAGAAIAADATTMRVAATPFHTHTPGHASDGGSSGEAADELGGFYTRFADLQALHRKTGGDAAPAAPAAAAALATVDPTAAAAVLAALSAAQSGITGANAIPMPGGGAAGGRAAAPTGAAAEHALPPAAAPLATAVRDTVVQGTMWSPEEVYGRFVHMQAAFQDWCALPGVKEARAAVTLKSGDGVLPPSGTASAGVPAGKADYVTWLSSLPRMHVDLPRRVKRTRQYRRHVASVAHALWRFFVLTHPLLSQEEVLRAMATDFLGLRDATAADSPPAVPPALASWAVVAGDDEAGDGAGSSASGGVSGSGSGSGSGGDESAVDLSPYDSAAAILEALTAEGCKVQCRLRGLKQGGSGLDRAERLWAVRGLQPAQYPRKLLAPAPAPGSGSSGAPAPPDTAPLSASAPADTSSATSSPTAPPIADLAAWAAVHVVPRVQKTWGSRLAPADVTAAWCEDVLIRLAGGPLSAVITATVSRLDKLSTRTPEEAAAEREAEADAAVAGILGLSTGTAAGGTAAATAAALGDDDDDAPLYASPNVLVDADGNPIPAWLYKLHGLNIEHRCEICGGATYRGRRDFDKHFQEWQHTYRMRLLGIPNTRHFHDIVRIADAQALWLKLQAAGMQPDGTMVGGGAGGVGGGAEEEFEDSSGNVVGRRTYEDLVRMGML